MDIACPCCEMSLAIRATTEKSRDLPLLCHRAVGCSQVLGLTHEISSRDVMKVLIPPTRQMLL